MKGVLVEGEKNTGKRNYYLHQEWDEKTVYKKRDKINCLQINNKNIHGDSNFPVLVTEHLKWKIKTSLICQQRKNEQNQRL